MRECIYCGKALNKDEKCNCAMSVAKRMEKENIGEKETPKQETPKKEPKIRKPKQKRNRPPVKNTFTELGRLFMSFIKSPIDTVMNPGEMSWTTIILLVALEGLIGGLCVFSVVTGAVRGPISLLSNAMGFKGAAGYEILKGWVLAGLSGIVAGIVIFYLYSGIFFVVNKFIVRQFSPYREFVKRFAFVVLPLSLLGILSVIFGLFSQTTFLILIICGLTGCVIITYEILRSMWYSKTPGKTMYLMMACIFIFLLVLINFIKVA